MSRGSGSPGAWRIREALTMHAPSAGLYKEAYERHSCGFGLIASLDDAPSHWLVRTAISSLIRLTHRGAIAADGKTGDGCGLLLKRPEGFLRPLQQQPAAVAGLAVGRDRAAVSETDQGADRGANQPVARRIVQARDQAEAATVALVGLFIESGGRGMHGESLADPPGAGRS